MNHPANNTVTREPFTPWFREPWVWAIIGLLLTTFVWGTYRIVYAFNVQDSVVVDDYYKNGKTINQDLTRDQNARDLAISASLSIDDVMGEVRVTVHGQVQDWPGQLKLSLLSPTFAERDQVLMLTRTVTQTSDVVYVGQIDFATQGRTYIHLETLDELIPEVGYETGWRLNQTHQLSLGDTVQLSSHL